MKKKVTIAVLAAFVLGIAMFIGTKITNKVELTAEDRRALSYDQVTDEGAVEGTEFVKFGAFFLRDLDKDGNAELLLGTCKELGEYDDLYIDLNVLTEGYLENAKITINGNNFFFKTQEVTNGDLKKDYVGENTKVLEFNTINCGTQKLIIGQVRSGIYSNGEYNSALKNNINNYTATNTITLTGTHVDDEGNRTEIVKTVPIIVDWYGKIKTEIQEYNVTNNVEYQDNVPQDSEGIIVSLKVGAEAEGDLLLKSSHIEATIPQLQGYDPISVTCDSDNVAFNYNSETRKVTLDRESIVDEQTGNITDSISKRNNYYLTVKYPLEAYQAVGGDGIAISFPVEATYTGFNNQNEEFTNPYPSSDNNIGSTTYRRPVGENVRIDVDVGEYYYDPEEGTARAISKELPLNIYNNTNVDTEKEDLYNVKWIIDTGSEPADAGLIIIEDPNNPSDAFASKDGSSESMEPYAKFKSIYFTNPKGLLGENGWIDVYNAETNELIKHFEGEELFNCTYNNQYTYTTPLNHVKVITSKYGKNSYCTINHVKVLNDNLLTNDHTLEEFTDIKSINSFVEGSMIFDDNSVVRVNSELGAALYLYPYSIASIEIDKDWISTQSIQEDVTFTIDTSSDGLIKSKWKDGTFLVKLPEEMYYIDIKNVSSNVTVDSYEIVELENQKAIKIYTSNEEPKDVRINIKADLACDPAVISKTAKIELYAENTACKNYYSEYSTEDIYDINYNDNTAEKILLTNTTLNLISPTSLITSQELSNYDNEGSITLAPTVADVSKNRDEQDARITIKVFNNYNSTITDTKLIGKIPSIDNTYPINGRNMGSQFDVTIKGEIVVPEELKNIVTVYYSTKDKVTTDLNSRANDWKTNPEDFSTVKSYLIDFGDYNIPTGKRYEFYYDIEISDEAKLNQISYSDHAIYYALNTTEGKYNTQTEPSKLGIRLVKKYNISLTKYEKGTTKLIPNTLYKIVDVTTNEAKTASTDSNGNLTFESLYVGRQYKLSELRSNPDYIYDSNEINFIVNSSDDENIDINILSGNLRTQPTITDNKIVNFETENEVKYNLKLTKYDETSRNALADVKFSIDGGGYVNRIFTTNSEGILKIDGLIPETEYTLKETEANGYYIRGDNIKFKVERNGANLQINIISGQFVDNPNITTSNDTARPTINIDYTNEKVPTYNFEIQKYVDGTTEPIKGVRFVLNGPTINNRVFETNSEGKINVEDLYIFDENRDQEATYTLRETYAPGGYLVDKTPIEFSIKKDGENLTINSISNNEVTYDFDQENNKFILKIANKKNLKIVKTDKETGEPMPNVEFYLYSDDGSDIGVDSQRQYVSFRNSYNNNFTVNMDENYYEFEATEDDKYGEIDFKFTLPEEGTVKFDWIPEISDSDGRLYYRIRDDSYNTVASNELSGIVYSGMISQNIFESEEVKLDEGEYLIEFYANETDKAIIKNFEVYYGRDNGIKLVTDENGEINANINSGRYELREVTPDGYIEIDPIKLGFGSSYDKHKALDFLSSEIVNRVDHNEKENELIDLGKGYYLESFEDSYYDSTNDRIINGYEDYGYILYKKDDNGVITNYVTFTDYYKEGININKNKIYIDEENNIYLLDSMGYYINNDYYDSQNIVKFDSELNIVASKYNDGYKDIKFYVESDKLYAYYFDYLSKDSENESFGATIDKVDQNGSKCIKTEFDKDLNVTNAEVVSEISILSQVNDDYFELEVTDNSLVGKNILGYTIQEDDINKILLLKNEDLNTANVIEKFDTSSLTVRHILEYENYKIIIAVTNNPIVLSDGTNIDFSGEVNDIVLLKYDNDNNYISSQYVTNSSLQSINNKYDDIFFTTINYGNSTINGTAEITTPIDETIIKYNVEDGIIEGYNKYSDRNLKNIIKLDNGNYIASDGYSVYLLDNHLNTIWENNVTSKPEDGSTWIDNVVEMDDGSLVMTYNIKYEKHKYQLSSYIKQALSDADYYYEDPWTESYLIKYDADGNLIFVRGINNISAKIIKTDNSLKINNEKTNNIQIDRVDVDTTDPEDTKYIVYANTNSNKEITNAGYNKIIYHEVDMYDYPESNLLEIQNEKNSLNHDIYTSYATIEDSQNGNITGWLPDERRDYENNYFKHIESVKDGDNSTIKIKATPKEGYYIAEIRVFYVNGDIMDRNPEIVNMEVANLNQLGEGGTYTLPIFENVKNNIVIMVHFEPINAEVEVNHYIKGTTTKVAPSSNLYGEVGQEYSTVPYADIADYQLEEDEEGNLILPDNKNGVFTEEKQVVNYYYVPKAPILVVHHYLEGTEYSLAPDETIDVTYDSTYTTQQATPPNIDEKYIKVSDSGNTEGTITQRVTEVIYYYNSAKHNITTEVEGNGGIISGQDLSPYETVAHGKDSTKEIKITPDDGYRIDKITVNGSEVEFTPEEDGTFVLPIFNNMTEDKHVVVTFVPNKYTVTITKQWEDNEDENEKRPTSILIDMLYDNETIREIELAQPWTTTYNIDTVDKNGNSLDFNKLTFIEKEVNSNDLEFYDGEVDYSLDSQTGTITVNVTNTYRVPEITKEITFTKQWEDNSNEYSKRPEQIKIVAKNGDDVVKEVVVDVTEENTITDTIYGLPYYDEKGQEITYTIDEIEVNENDLKFYSKQIDQTTYTITNTFTVPEDKTSVDVIKKWKDNSNENATRPAQIKLQVKNGDTVVQEQVVNVDNTTDEKVYTFENLALYDSTGQEIVYTVDETEVNENDLIGYTKAIKENIITNAIVKHKITTEVNGDGGSISGENENPYEEVNHKGNSVKDVVITPEPGYKIKSITINDEPQELPEDVFSEYNLAKFEEMTEDKHIVVEFELVEHVITTEVEGIGGSISGQNEAPYETVVHSFDSTKEIKATPDSGYKITSITVNGTPIEFSSANDGTYTLPLFENMTEDKHIVVKFERKETSVVVKHQTEDGTDLVDPETIPGRVGDDYTTEPKEFPDYDLKTTPDNAEGNMTEEQIEVIYVYSKVKGSVTVTKVDKTDNSILLEGAVFKLEKVNDSDEIDQTFVAREERTNNQGKAVFGDLEVGKYRLTEIQAPDNYELTNEVVDVEVTKAERDVNIVAKDRMKIVLPATGKINYSMVLTGIGLIVITTAFMIKKKDKKQFKNN